MYFFLIWLVKLFFPRYWTIPTALIYAQAKLETGNFSSDIFKFNNNLFGMKQSFKTKGGFIELGTERGHAFYKNKFDSIRDYFIRQKNGFNIQAFNSDEYIENTILSNYAEDVNYRDKWVDLFKALNPFYKYISYILLPFFVLFIFWFFSNKSFFKFFN